MLKKGCSLAHREIPLKKKDLPDGSRPIEGNKAVDKINDVI
jgi:hypothetical protein